MATLNDNPTIFSGVGEQRSAEDEEDWAVRDPIDTFEVFGTRA